MAETDNLRLMQADPADRFLVLLKHIGALHQYLGLMRASLGLATVK